MCLQLQSGSATITVNPLPTATIAGTRAVCRNDDSPDITFTGASGSAPYTFTYTINGGAEQTVNSVGTIATIAAPTGTAGTFVYTLVDVRDASSATCSNTANSTATITVNPLPTATIAGTAAVCQNAISPNITFTGTAGTAPYTFTYRINGGVLATITTISGNSVTVAAPTGTAGTFTYSLVSVQDASSTICSQNQAGTATITVNPLPTATIAGSTDVCQISSPQPTITLTNPMALPIAITYNINGGGITTVNVAANSIERISQPTTPAGDFVYNLVSVAYQTAPSCSNLVFGNATVTVNSTPTVNTIGDRILCNNTTAPGITLSGPVVGTSFQWTNSNTAIGLPASGTGNIPVFAATNGTNGQLTGIITVTPTANGCVGTPLTFTITINPTLTASIAGSTTVCQNDDSPDVTFTNPMSVPVTITYRSNSIAHTINVAANSTNTVAVPTNTADTYTYELVTVAYQSNPTCPNNITGSAIVIVNPKANAVATPSAQAICSGQALTPIVLTSSTAGVTYNWTRNNTATVTGIANSGSGNISGTLTNTTSSPVIVTFTITANVGGCVGTPENATVTVSPTPVATVIPTAQTRCSGEAISSIVPGSTTGGTTFTWTRDHVTEVTGLPASGTGPVPTVSLTNTTSSSVTVTFIFIPTANNCEGLPVTATVLMRPKASINNLTASICNLGTFNVSPINGVDGVVPPGTNYSWRIQSATAGITGAVAGNGSIISGTLGNSTNFTQSVTYAVTPTNDGCVEGLFLLTVTVVPEPAINNINSNVCSGNTFSVSPINGTNGIVPPGTTYSWSAPTGGVSGGEAGSGSLITGTLVNSTLTTQTATYTVRPVSGTCTGENFIITVTVNPVASVNPMTVGVCSGGSFTLTPVNVTNGAVPSGTTYSWSAPAVTGGVTGGVVGSGATGISGTLTNPTSSVQTATYTVTPSSGGCAGAAFPVTVTVYPKPAVNPMVTTICSGGSFNLLPVDGTNGSVPAGTTYSWAAPNVAGITGTASGTAVSSISGQLYNTSGTAKNVTYTVTPSAGGCAGTSFSVIVTVSPAPSVNNMVATVCSGTGFTITPVNGTNGTIPPGTTYSWSTPTVTGGITGGASGSGAANMNGTLTNSTNTAQTATYTITPSSGSCAGNTFNLTVTVYPVPSVSISGGAEVCYGGTAPNITFTNQVNLPVLVTYNINGGANFTINIAASGTTSIPATVNQEGTFVYNLVSVAYQTAPTCSTPASGTATITIKPITTVAISRTPSGTICFGESVSYSSNVANAGINHVYQWYLNGAAISGATGISYTSTTLNNSDKLRLVVTTIDTPCPGAITSNEITMTVNPSVIPSVNIYESANPICPGTSVTFTANPVINGGTSPTFEWQVNGITVGGNSSTYTTNTLVSGDQVRVILTSNALCAVNPATSNTVAMTVNPNLPVSVTVAASANPVCAGTPATFTATPTNGGSTPAYQWKVNGVNAGTNSSTFSYTPANNDVVTVVLTSNATCATGSPATSNAVTMIVNPNLPVSVNVVASANPVCAGTSITFTANPTNGGTTPAYQWRVNGVNAGTNSNTYSYTPANNDVVTVVLTSNATCATSNPATSTPVTITVNPNLPVSVAVAASANPVCAGTSVTFTATPTNGGNTPAYQWKVNGVNAGTNSSTYSYSPANNDVVTVVLTSNATCATSSPATSNAVTMTVNPNLPVSVAVAASANPVCAGTPVTFTATPTNGGTTPAYQWRVNGVNAGTNSNTYSYTPANNDVVTLILTSNATCATSNPATSTPVTMTVNPNLPVSVAIAASANPVCAGTPVTFTATPTNGGTTPAYQWKVNGVNAGTNSSTYSYSPANNDVVTIVLTSNATCATGSPATSNSITLNVVTGIPATPGTISGPTAICPVQIGIVYSIAPVSGASSYNWSVPAGWNITSGQGTTSITVNADVQTTGSKTISVTATNACGSRSNSLPVTVNTFAYANAGPDQVICTGINLITLAGVIDGAVDKSSEWDWLSSGGGNFSNGGNDLKGTYTLSNADKAAGTFTITISTFDPSVACDPVSDFMVVTIIPIPTVSAGGPDVVCQSATPSAIALAGASVGGGGGLTTGAWSIVSGGGSLSSTAQTAIPATVTYTPAANFNGVVTLRLTTNTPGGCTAVSAIRTITINATPTVNPGGPISVCQSASPLPITLSGASFTVATSAAWSITSGGGNLSNTATTATPATVTYTPAANYSGFVILTLLTNDPDGAGPCSAISATRTITVNQAAILNAGGPDVVCQSATPSPITLSGASFTVATTAAWSVPPGSGTLSNTAQTATPSSITFTPAVNFSGAITLTLTTNDPDGAGPCSPVSATRTITVNQAATVNPGGPNSVCQSATPSAITLSGASVGGGASTGAWSITAGGGTLSNETSQNNAGIASTTYTPAANFSGTVTLALTTNAPVGCSAVSATRTISVNPAPTVNAGGPDVVCQSATPSAITLAGSSVGGGATTGTWSVTTGGGTLSNSTPQNNAGIASTTYTPAANFSGTVTLRLTTNAPGNCTAVSATKTITVNPAPTVNAGTYTSICSGSAVTLAGSISGGATTGTWTGGGGTFNPDRNTLNAIYTPSGAEIAAGTVTLTLTTTDHPATCGAVSSSTTITINKAVVITTQPVNTGACVGNLASLSVVADGTNLSYQWFKGTALGTIISGATSSTLTFNSVSLTDDGSYYIVVIGESPCPEVTSTIVTLNVDAAITITSQPANQTKCEGENVTFSVIADAGGAPLTYQWRKNGVDISGAILSTYSITGITSVADAGSYDVVVGSSAGFNCSSVTSSTATLTVNENGTILLTGNDNQNVCAGISITSITYTIGGSSTGAELTGFLPGGVTHSFSGGVFILSGTPTEQGTFNYTVTAKGSSCENPSLSGTITVDGIGTISLGGGTATSTLCINNPLTAITYAIGGNATGAVISAGSLPTGVNGVYANGFFTISGTPTTAGTYPFTVSTTGSACGNQSLSGTITVNSGATIALTSANANQTICIGSPISPISYTSGGSSTSIVLTGQLPAGVTGSTIGNVSTISGTPTSTGTFNYTVTTTGPCSNTSLNGVLQVDYLPDGGFISPAVSTVCTTTNSGTLTLESYSGNIIQWEYSIDGGNTWVIDPVTTNTYHFTNLPNTTLFTALVGNANCPALYSGIARVTVIPVFTPTITVSGGDVCSGEPVTLTATAIILPETTGVITGGTFNSANPKGWRVWYNGNFENTISASGSSTNPDRWLLTTRDKTFCGNATFSSEDKKFSVVNGALASTMETPVFSLIAMSSAELTFKHAYNLSAGSTAQVEISTDGGNTYNQVLADYSGRLMGGNPNVVNPINIDLSPYLGMDNLRIRFNYASTTCSAWAIDDITLPAPQPDVDFTWGPVDLIPGGSGSTVVVLPPTTTTYTLTVWIAGCPGVATAQIVTVVNIPEVQTTNACVGGGPVTFTHTSAIIGGTWTVSGGGSITSDGVFTPTEPGCFEATYTTPNSACSGMANFVVFPAAPTPTVNTGCGPIVVTPPPAINGFNIEYSFDNGATWGANTPPTEESCSGYYIKTRYVTASLCDLTPVGEVSLIPVCSESPATVRRIDYSDPTFTVPADITIYKDASCNYNASPGVTGDVTDESDNCPDNLNATYTDLIVPGACEDELIIERTWLLEDGCGKQNVQIQRITVSDNTPPVISPLAADDQSGCSTGNPNNDPAYLAWLSSRGGAAATDNCDQILTWSDNSATQTWSGITGNNQITITWVVTDNCSNIAETTATYSITDTEPPTIVCPKDISETALVNNCDKILVTPSDPTVNDNCSATVLSYTLSGATTVTNPVVGTVRGVTFNVGVTTVTYTATDAAGNKSEPCSFTITILDITPPNLTIGGCEDVSESAAANNCSKKPVTIIDPTYSDDCWPLDQLTLSWTMTGSTTGSGNGSVVGQTFNVGVTKVTYQVEDPDGNKATCSFTVTILDVTPPNLTIGGCEDVSESATAANCSKIPVTIIDPTYSDDCWPLAQLTLTWTMTGSTTGSGNGSVVGQTFNVGVTTVTYQVEDPDGNKATCSFKVTILRLDIPEAAITCPESPAAVTAVSGTCFGDVIVAPPVEVDPCETVTYTLENDFNHTGNASGSYPVGSTTVTWTITDNSKRTITCVQTVTVNNLPPTITCPEPIVVQAGFELPYQDEVIVPAPAYGDNCPNPVLIWTLAPPAAYADQYAPGTLSGTGIYPSPSMFYLGVTIITYLVTDANGTTATCSFTVTVLAKPEITCLPTVPYVTDPGQCTATRNSSDYGLPTLVGGLQPIIWTWTITNPDGTQGANGTFTGSTATPGPPSIPDYAFHQGTSTILWRTENISGFDECTQTIAVTDNQPPMFIVPNPLTECVQSLISAVYDPATIDILPLRPDYYILVAGSTKLDITDLKDNCCNVEDLIITWTIDFSDAHPDISGDGQPSEYDPDNDGLPNPITLWGTTDFTDIQHTITYTVTDCNNINNTTVDNQTITIHPRPELIKTTMSNP
jgi:hypothetical protein